MSPAPHVRDSSAIRRIPTVRDMMTRDFVSLRPDASIREAAKILVRRRAPGAAVVDIDDRFLGFVSSRGVLAALAEFLHDERPVGPLREYLDPDPPRLFEDTSLMAAIHWFGAAASSDRLLPVLRGNELVGVVAHLDVVRAVMSYLGGGEGSGPATLYISALRRADEGPDY